jgi:hypothetical protein
MGAHEPTRSRPAFRAASITLAGLAVATAFALVAEGFYHEDDIEHVLIARDAWGSVDKMLHWWGRPGFTIPAMFADRLLGVTGCRLLSVAMTGLAAWLAYRIARRIAGEDPVAGRYVWLAPALLWVQPLVVTLAQTTLTETPALLGLTAAVWLGLSRRRVAACAVMSLVFVTRLETLALGPLVGAAVVAARWRETGSFVRAVLAGETVAAALALVWAPTAWVVSAVVLDVEPESSPLVLLHRGHTDAYGTGGWHHMPLRWVEAAGVGVLLLAVAGVARLGRRAILPAANALALLTLHAVLYRYGLFASGGYARFLVPASGVVAALAAAGVGPVRARSRLALGALVLLIGVQGVGTIRPLILLARPPAALADTENLEVGPWVLWRPLSPGALVEETLLAAVVDDIPAGTPILSNRGFVRCRRPEAVRVGREDAIRRWLEAAPGTRFVRGLPRGRPGDTGVDDPGLAETLERLGRVVDERHAGPFRVRVHERSSAE